MTAIQELPCIEARRDLLSKSAIDSLTLSILLKDPNKQILVIGATLVVLVGIIFAATFKRVTAKHENSEPDLLTSLLRFVYACFLKPHDSDNSGSQQAALESFYKAQANVYDATRSRLLRGRKDMLGLVSAHLKQKYNVEGRNPKSIWVDIGGGTGYNIEAMAEFVSVPDFFSSIYLVDFSPSLCEVARKRFARLGWKNVKVVCQDARLFRLADHECGGSGIAVTTSKTSDYFTDDAPIGGGADLITMSYSLSMIPDFYSVIDSLPTLLSPSGVVGVVDFYVQSGVDLTFRNYTGGALTRHVNWFGRLFWRAWFDVDRVALEAGRRDYLEYRFGTVLSADCRNYLLGAIPYYVWIGCRKIPASTLHPQTPGDGHEIVARLDAVVTESPYLHPVNHTQTLSREVERVAPELRSKAYDAAVINLSANLPLPSFFYQNHHWRIYYDDQLKKHAQFKNEYIYAFTWEDTRVDNRLLKLNAQDVVLAITSAGDNILSYALSGPARIHAIDLNPAQNHLLELKVASLTALPYADHWKLFGLGKHTEFRSLLISKLSPHLSSRAFQYWLDNCNIFASRSGYGLYDTGGSRHALRAFRVMTTILGLRRETRKMLEAKTLNEQREIWKRKLRPVFLSRILSYLMVSQPRFLWAALGVPHNQCAMLEADYAERESAAGSKGSDRRSSRGAAIWEYMVHTLDPVIENTLIGADNPYYLVCLQGHYTQRCHPAYLAPKAHHKLSRSDAFDGLRIHTDEIDEVLARITPGTLTVAVIMDSMDWFDPGASAAALQIRKLNHALKLGGRVLLRSAGLTPWYIKTFADMGFSPKHVGARIGGSCIDRVNMYASCWLITKKNNLAPLVPELSSRSSTDGFVDMERLEL